MPKGRHHLIPEYRLVKDHGSRVVTGMEGDFSLFAISDQVTVSFTGLKYPLHHQTLTNTFPLGVSNSFTGGSASVTVTDGAAVAVLEGKAIPLFLKAGSI